jgi:hypothetical protein
MLSLLATVTYLDPAVRYNATASIMGFTILSLALQASGGCKTASWLTPRLLAILIAQLTSVAR